jgi:hypothetical protein
VQLVEYHESREPAPGASSSAAEAPGGGLGGFELGAVARAKQQVHAAVAPRKSALAKPTAVFAASAADAAAAAAAADAAAVSGGGGPGSRPGEEEPQRKRSRVRGWLSGDGEFGAGGGSAAAGAADLAASGSSDGHEGDEGLLARLRDEQALYAATVRPPFTTQEAPTSSSAATAATAAAAAEPEPEKKDRWGSDSDSE